MDPQNFEFLINLFVAFASLIPLTCSMLLYKRTQPGYYGLFIWGILLIICAAFNFQWLSEVLDKSSSLRPRTDAEIDATINVVSTLKVWLYICPGVTAAVGSNLITEFMLRRRGQNA